MKKLILLAAALLLLGTLTACGRNAAAPAWKDGTWTAEAEDYMDGWKDVVTITVSGGRITEVDWDALSEDGGPTKRQRSIDGTYDMVAGGARSQWHEQAASIEAALVDADDPDGIKIKPGGQPDAVSGVTIKVDTFLALAGKALEQAR